MNYWPYSGPPDDHDNENGKSENLKMPWYERYKEKRAKKRAKHEHEADASQLAYLAKRRSTPAEPFGITNLDGVKSPTTAESFNSSLSQGGSGGAGGSGGIIKDLGDFTQHL